MNVSGQDYRKMTKDEEPKSPVFKNCIMAFLVGGIICTLGQIVTMVLMMVGVEEKQARSLGSISLIFLSMLLTGLGVFDNIAKHAGAGTIVPITGFANAMVSPAIEFKTEGFILGLGAKMFQIAGPVLVYGVSASVIYGVILWIITLFR